MTPWREYKKTKKYPELDRDIEVDVCVIGGGMAGILNAYRLSRGGKSVALVEKKELAGYATMDTTAFITKVIDTDLSEIVSIFGDKVARSVWQSGQEAIEEFDRIIKEEKINCEFTRCPNYLFASSKKQFEGLKEDFQFYRRFKLGASLHEPEEDLGFKHYGYIKIPDQAKFHPTKFLYALAEKSEEYGAKIFENTEALDIEVGKPITIKTSGGTIVAKDIVIATYKPLTNKKTHLKKMMYRSYVFEVEVPKGLFEEAIYEDGGNPYYYFRIDSQKGADYDRMIVGGEDHKDIFGDKLAKKSFNALHEFVNKLMGGKRFWLIKKWSGPILEPSDGLALVGRIKPHQYVATGFSGNGMTYSMISSMIINDLIDKKRNAWAKVYDPTRSLLHPKRLATKARDYVEEFFSGAVKNMLK